MGHKISTPNPHHYSRHQQYKNLSQIQQKFLQICNQLNIVNSQQYSLDQLQIDTLSSNIISNIYRIKFKCSSSIVVKLYADIDGGFDFPRFTQSQLINDVLISQLNHLEVGENYDGDNDDGDNESIGAKVLLLNHNCIVMQHLPVIRSSSVDDMHNPWVMEQIARTLARLHQMKPSSASNVMVKHHHSMMMSRMRMLNRCSHRIFSSSLMYRIESELKWIQSKLVLMHHHQMVFSHNNFQPNNILLCYPQRRNRKNGTKSFQRQMIQNFTLLTKHQQQQQSDHWIWPLIDDDYRYDDDNDTNFVIKFVGLDHLGYFYRGADFGRYFAKIFDTKDTIAVVDDDAMLQFIDWYLDEQEQEQEQSQQHRNRQSSSSLSEQILCETKHFILYTNLIDLINDIDIDIDIDNDISTKQTDIECIIEKKFQNFLLLKQQFKLM